jgi:hypothetical protein
LIETNEFSRLARRAARKGVLRDDATISRQHRGGDARLLRRDELPNNWEPTADNRVPPSGKPASTSSNGLSLRTGALTHALDTRATSTGPMIDRLISGADRGSQQGLVEKRKDGSFQTTELDLFYPMASGKIGGLPSEALRSRCIVIQMHPATAEEAEQLSKHSQGEAGANVRPLLMKVMKDRAAELGAARPTFPPGFVNRGEDKWRPLLAIAEAAADNWPKRALDAATELERIEQDPPQHVALLCRVVAVTKDWPHPVIFSDELDRALAKPGASETAGHWSAKLRGNTLAQVGLKAERRWRDGKQLRGYLIADIQKAASQYLRPDTCDA